MKIAYCIPSMYNPGGMERVLTQKVNYLSSVYNYDITILTTEQNGKPFYFPLNKEINKIDFNLNFDDHYQKNIFVKTFIHLKKLKEYKNRLEHFLKMNNINLCVSLCGKEIDFLTSLKDSSIKIAELHFAKNYRKQFIMSIKNGLFWKSIGVFRSKQFEHNTKKLHKLVVLTKSDEQEWKKTHSNIAQIYNPCSISTPLYSTLENKRAIAIGRLDAQKGFDNLIESWALVAKRFPDWTLDIFCKGEQKEMFDKMIIENQLENIIFLKGVTNDVQKEFLDASLCVMTSRYEGFGLVLLEAMTCGVPCVSFDCEFGPNEIIKDDHNGFLVPVANVKLLADKICLLIENRKLRINMGNKAKESANKFNLNSIMTEWNGLFENALKKSNSSTFKEKKR